MNACKRAFNDFKFLILCKFVKLKEVKSGGSLAWAIMARSLFSRLGTACLLYLYVINVIYLVPNKAVKKIYPRMPNLQT